MTYHPHGDSSGEIAHGANKDTGDTPGSTGGKFIGFGEDGTSAIANRAHWALSENIDHVYDGIKREIAVPYAYKRTAVDQGGGGEVSLQLPTGEDVWVGDDSYPGVAGTSDLEGMMMLFSVLDDYFNELTDDSENEIRVKMVKESTGTTDVYQDSFQDQPIIYFIAVDPVTGVTVTDPYIIPTGTAYRVAYGVQSTLEELPADALVRYKIQSSTEVQAGVILQDGTKKMTGDLDIDGNNVLNPAAIEGAAASDMLLYSKQDLNFRDQNFTTPIPFGETGQSGLYQPVSASIHPSVLGALNSSAESREMLTGNRCVDRTGSITTSGADVTYPALRVMLQGQVVDIAGDTITGTTVTDKYRLIVTPAGVVSLVDNPTWGDDLADPIAGSVVIWEGSFTSPSTWSDTADLRWPGTRQGNHVSLYVGSGIGADHTSLDEVVDWVTRAGIGVLKSSISYEIVIVGAAEVAATVTIPKGWTLRGLTRLGEDTHTASIITSAAAFDEGTDVIILGEGCTVKNLSISWGADADQDSGYVGLRLNDFCLVEGVNFTNEMSKFDSNIGASLTNDYYAGPVIRDCYFYAFNAAGITIVGEGRVQIDNSTFNSTTAAYHIDLVPSGTTLDGTGPSHTITNCFFNGRPTEANIRVGGPNVLIDSCYGKLGTGGANSAFVSIVEGFADNTRAGVTMRNCLAVDGKKFVSCVIDDQYMELSVLIEGCTCTGFSDTVFFFDCVEVDAGQTTIRDCDVRGQTAGYAAYFDNVDKVSLVHNSFKDGSGTVATGIYVDDSVAIIDGNYIDSWQTGPGITLYSSATNCSVINNHVDYKGVQSSVVGVYVGGAYNRIEGNVLLGVTGQDYAEVGVYVTKGYNSVLNNKMRYWAKHFVHVYANTDVRDFHITGNSFLSGCAIEVTVGDETDVQAAAICFEGSAGTEDITDVVISGNVFRYFAGSAIRAEDALVSNVAVSDNIFDAVQGRYLHDDGGANMEKQAVIAIQGAGLWTISNNTFQGCGFQNVNEDVTIAGHIIYLNTVAPITISGNQFGQAIMGSGDVTRAVTDSWYDIAVWGNGDIICNNNSFVLDLTDYPYAPTSYHAQLYKRGTGCLILTGCLFSITGDVGIEYGGHAAFICGPWAIAGATGSVMASSCFTRGGWIAGVEGLMWKLEGPIEGSVVGCTFDGPHNVNLQQANGFSLGVVHTGALARVLTPGVFPSTEVYDTEDGTGNTSNPRADFNRQV